MSNNILLQGKYVRLETLDYCHTDGLVAASEADPSLYRLSPVQQGKVAVTKYIAAALSLRDAGTALPFATIRMSDNAVIGSTRFWNIERWLWPQGHPRFDHAGPDGCEIGYTWLTKSAIRTGTNTEAKLLMLTHAFETWGVLRVCFHADVRNDRSRKAIERIGGKFEGILRAHRMAADFIPRDSARYSIIAEEWPEVKERLSLLLR